MANTWMLHFFGWNAHGKDLSFAVVRGCFEAVSSVDYVGFGIVGGGCGRNRSGATGRTPKNPVSPTSVHTVSARQHLHPCSLLEALYTLPVVSRSFCLPRPLLLCATNCLAKPRR